MSAVAEIKSADRKIPEVISKLRRTFDSGRTRSAAWRDAQLARISDLLTECSADLQGALQSDLGRSGFESTMAELVLVQNEIAHARKSLGRWMKPSKVGTPMALQPGKSQIIREPLGVVLVIAPWNYPVQLAILPLVSAIAAGNCVLVKPSEVAAKTSETLARLIPRYLDTEAVAVIEGGVPETSALLEERFDHIFYTGNGAVGRIVMTAAAKHLTPVTLELGGKSPTIVDASADLDVTARRIVWGKYFNAGQTCVAPDYVLVARSIETKLCDALARTVREFYGADPKKSEDYGRIINVRHHRRLTALLASGEAVVGGQHDEADRYIAPTVLKGVKADSPVMADEIFGPILPVLAVDSVNEAVAFINARPKPLALYVFTGDRGVADDVLARTSSGGACVNDAMMHLANHSLPFGGVGESGMGAYHGKDGFECFSHRRSVLLKGTSMDLPIRYPPYNEKKKVWLKRLM